MNSALEFHDSEVEEIRMLGDSLYVTFRAAYVHRSEGRPGVDAGSGYLQAAEMIFSQAQYSETAGPCAGAVSDGVVSAEGAEFVNVIPLPFSLAGQVSARIAFVSGGALIVTGSSVSCVATGPARHVEAYEG